eukprot:SAG31_NODE_417_length_15907_cov_6.901759_18_plen_76_part_00
MSVYILASRYIQVYYCNLIPIDTKFSSYSIKFSTFGQVVTANYNTKLVDLLGCGTLKRNSGEERRLVLRSIAGYR